MNDRMSDFATHEETPASNGLAMGVTWLFVGLAAGALTALLLAPRTGKQLRKSIRRTYLDARGAVEDFSDQAGDWIQKGADLADRARSTVAPLVKPFRR